MLRTPTVSTSLLVTCLVAVASAQTQDTQEAVAEREAALAKMLSGATLEGSFTMTTRGFDPTKLTPEKYTLGEVKKVTDNAWVFPTRIQYADRDLTLPITLPIEWAGDTPVVVVDNLGLPGLGTVSARVMFFADHYAGYWKHGDAGGHLFGVIYRADDSKPLRDASRAGHQSPQDNDDSQRN